MKTDALALIEAVSFLRRFFFALKRYKRIAGNSSLLHFDLIETDGFDWGDFSDYIRRNQ
jgi:hypothetical protein